eukprot:m.266522 g.266522  ORF g.266522 m.266522 type:complete len:529 (+) comp15631_c0_seq3:155-1741(+)
MWTSYLVAGHLSHFQPQSQFDLFVRSPYLPASTTIKTKIMSASVSQVAAAINRTCKQSGGVYRDYSCKYVSWDDACRGTVGGGLSCWGANITDTYLKSKSGQRLFTVRSDNWNEKLGFVDASRVAVVAGNTVKGSTSTTPITLRTFLESMGHHGAYAGVKADTNLYMPELDSKVSIRFQTTFIPVRDSSLSTEELCTEAYNYNTRSDSDPRNMIVLATTQGIAIQQDGSGTKRIYHHAVNADGSARQHWLEVERSSHKVGGAQHETEAEMKDALKRGKAISSVIGVEAMGTRFNVLMTIQIPLKQQQQPRRQQQFPTTSAPLIDLWGLTPSCNSYTAPSCCFGSSAPTSAASFAQFEDFLFCDEASDDECDDFDATVDDCFAFAPEVQLDVAHSVGRQSCARPAAPRHKVGTANAARVSRGSDAGPYQGLSAKTLVRDPSQHITVTVVIYNTIAGGVPSVDDVKAAIDDMESLYAACKWSGRLADAGAADVTAELTVKDTQDIATKVATQPPRVSKLPIHNRTLFPTC